MTLVMGILNVTPDSFSDGGDYASTSAAVARGVELAAQGAHMVDVGGESTRPGAQRVGEADEQARVIPVVSALVREGITVSIDTMNASTARAAADAGASIVNDVSGGLADPAMASTVASLDVDYVCMHWRAHSTVMDQLDVYDDVVAEVARELSQRVTALAEAGVDSSRIILDPGLGFAKVGDNNWALLAHLDALHALRHRVLVGASRKRFLGGTDPLEREHSTTAVTTLSAVNGAWAVRVHNATAAVDAIAVVSAWTNASQGTR